MIDGGCRDVSVALGQGYPMFTRGRFMRTGQDRVEIVSVNRVVSLGRVRVVPRDIIVADANGVVVVPRARAAEIAGIARGIDDIESQFRQAIQSGKTLTQACAELGYHKLQRKSQ